MELLVCGLGLSSWVSILEPFWDSHHSTITERLILFEFSVWGQEFAENLKGRVRPFQTQGFREDVMSLTKACKIRVYRGSSFRTSGLWKRRSFSKRSCSSSKP